MSALRNIKFANVKYMLAAVALFAFSAPATAGSTTQYSAAKSANSDVSAAKKKKRVKHTQAYQSDGLEYYRARGIVPSMGYIGPPGYPGEYAWRKSIGQCVVDMGYGRWSSCNSP